MRLHRLEQLAEGKGLHLGFQHAGIQSRQIDQSVQHLLGGRQGGIDPIDQSAGVRPQAWVIPQGRQEQARGRQRLQQIMAGSSDEAGARFLRRLGQPPGLLLRLQRGPQLEGALFDPIFQMLVGFAQGVLGALEFGDVVETHDEATAGQGFAAHFHHMAISTFAHIAMRTAGAHMGQSTLHLIVDITGSDLAALSVVANQVGHRPTDEEHAVGIVEEFAVAPIPGHQTHLAIDHADALAHVLEGGLQQFAVEAQSLAGLVQHRDHLAQLQTAAAQHRGQHQPRRAGADGSGQQPLGEL